MDNPLVDFKGKPVLLGRKWRRIPQTPGGYHRTEVHFKCFCRAAIPSPHCSIPVFIEQWAETPLSEDSSKDSVLLMQGQTALHFGSLVGIPVMLHTSLLVFLLLFAAEHALTLSEAVTLAISMLTALYLHECGHLVGGRLSSEGGPALKNILLLPYGGSHHSDPNQGDKRTPLWFLLAPTFNFVAATVGALIFFQFLKYPFDMREVTTQFILTNAWLFACNLIPLPPLDSGEVMWRTGGDTKGLSSLGHSSALMGALLLLSWGELTATGAVGLAFFHSMRSRMFDTAHASMTQFRVREVMRPLKKIDTFTHGMSISDAVKIALRSWQDHFPVVLGKEVLGVIDRNALLRARASHDEEQYITGLVEKEYLVASPDEPLNDALLRAQSGGDEPLFVVDDGNNLLGMVATPQLLEVLLVDAVRRSRHKDKLGEP